MKPPLHARFVRRDVTAFIGSVAIIGGSSLSAEVPKEACIYGYPMVVGYRIQYGYFVDKTDPGYKGPWNEIHNIPCVYTPEDKAIQTPNSDTP